MTFRNSVPGPNTPRQKDNLRNLAATALATLLIASFTAPATAQTNEELLELVKEMRKEMEELRKQVEANTAKQQQQQQQLQETVGASVSSGGTGVELSVSGQVNRGILAFDDGEESDLLHVDNDNSSTRVRFVGKGDIDESWSVGTQIEVQFESNSSATVNQDDDRNVGPNNFTERKLEFYIDSDDYGRIWVGQGDTASNNTAEQDLSGTAVVGYSGISDMAGGLLFRDEDTGDLTDVTIGDVFSNLDGLSRDDRLRYDTPSFYGFKVSGSLIADSREDLAVFYDDTHEDVRIKGAAAVANVSDEFVRYDGSVSALHIPTGISGTFAAGLDDFDESGRDERHFYYGKLGYQVNVFEIGTTAVAVDIFRGENQASDGDEGNSIGAQFVQNIDKVGTELYIGARWHEYDDDTGVNYDDVFAVLTGGRVKF